MDETLAVCQRLWTEPTVEHHGEFFDFGPVGFEPKPVQQPWPKIHVGGESEPALRRAATAGDGWIGMTHTLDSVPAVLNRLRRHEQAADRRLPLELTVNAEVSDPKDPCRWADLGLDRLIVRPWTRSSEALEGLECFAEMYFG